MSRKIGLVISHWHQSIDGLQESSQKFYTSLEEAVKMREIPHAESSRVEHYERGAFSAKREYLRIGRGGSVFDICAAPFGKAFFVSWWFGELTPSAVWPTLIAFIVSGLLAYSFGARVALIVIAGIFLLVGFTMANESAEWHAYFLVIPGLGSLWRRIFIPATFYKMDTDSVFRDLVHKCVLDAVDRLTESKGLVRLTEEERKPIMRNFFETMRKV